MSPFTQTSEPIANQISFKNNFLIAMPSMDDPQFMDTVTLVCKHDQDGAVGIVINQATHLKVKDVLEQLSVKHLDCDAANQPVLFGGPINQDRGLVIHRPTARVYDSTLLVSDAVAVTTSRDVLEAMARNQGPQDAVVVVGYAGWVPGQLEQEIQDNVWLSTRAHPDVLFKTPIHQRRDAAAELLGIRWSALCDQAGHG